MYRLTIALPIAIMAAAGALAQDDDLRQRAEAFVQSEAMQMTLEQVLSPETFVAQLHASGMQLTVDQMRTVANIVDEQLAKAQPEFETALAAAAAETFTLAELEGMIDDYQSDVGRSSTAKMQAFLQSFYENLGGTLTQVQTDIVRQVGEELDLSDTDAPGEGASGD